MIHRAHGEGWQMLYGGAFSVTCPNPHGLSGWGRFLLRRLHSRLECLAQSQVSTFLGSTHQNGAKKKLRIYTISL